MEFVQCLNEIYAHLSVQYHDTCTHLVNIHTGISLGTSLAMPWTHTHTHTPHTHAHAHTPHIHMYISIYVTRPEKQVLSTCKI